MDGEISADELHRIIGEPYILLTWPVDHEGVVHPKIRAHGLTWQDIKDGLFDAARVTQSSRPAVGPHGPQ